MTSSVSPEGALPVAPPSQEPADRAPEGGYLPLVPEAPEAPADRYAPTTWGILDEELTVASGQMCRVKKLDFVELMSTGLMDQLNTLQGVVDKNVKKAEGAPPIDPLKMMADKRTAKQMAKLISEVVCMVVTAPVVVMPPEDPAKRVVGVVYADTVGIMDKMDIFSYAMGGLAELEAFRSGSKEAS